MAILKRPPEPDSLGGVQDRITAALPSLAPSERRAAEYLLARPGQAIALSITELADACGIAQSTVSRLCKRLGVANYAALRLGIANDFAAQAPSDGGKPAGELGELGQLGNAVGMLRTHGALLEAAEALRYATHVEVWPATGFELASSRLSDRLTTMAVPTASTAAQGSWAGRARGVPPGSLVIHLAGRSPDRVAMHAARDHGVQVLCCTSRPTASLQEATDWVLPLSGSLPDDLLAFTAAEAIARAVEEVSAIPGPEGPASPWRPWPHTRPVLFPGAQEPIPALFLAHEDPPRRRPVVIYFTGMRQPKEGALPGRSDTNNHFDSRVVAALINAGYHVVIPDTVAHGARKRAWEETVELICDSFQPGHTDVLSAARADASSILEGILGLEVPQAGVGVVGQSWGGLQSLLTMAGDSRLAAAVAINPLVDLLHWSQGAGLDTERVRAAQPGPWMGSSLAPRPVLLIAGQDDISAPPEPIQALAEEVQPAYRELGADGALVSLLLPAVGHHFHPAQLEATLDWLSRHLPPTGDEAV